MLDLSSRKVYGALKDEIDYVDRKLDDAMVQIWSPGGSYTFENLPAPSADTFRFAYVVTDDFTTTSDFVEGAGIDYPAGTTVGVVNHGTDANPVYMYDVSTGAVFVDSEPTQGSTNAVASGGVYDDLQEIRLSVSQLSASKISKNNTPGLVKNDGSIDTEIQLTVEQLSASLLLKADKVASATAGNFALLDSSGNLADSGHKDADYVHKTGNETISGNKHFTGDVVVDGNIIGKKGTIYGFHIDNDEDDPDEKVSYLYDAVGMKPAHMDFTNGVFDFGTWEDAFFMPKPCMLKPDGTVDFYLDKNNFKKKADGVSDSHVNHLHIVEASATAALAHAVDDYFVYDGKLYQATVAIEIGDTITPNTNCTEISGVNVGDNAMIEWGQNNQKIWYCIESSADRKSATILISNYKVNDSYKAWSFINMQGDMVDHFYTPAYKGVLVNGVMRSLSGCDYNYYVNSKTRAEEVALAEANNPSTDKLWYTEVRADNQLINFLTILMFKSTDIQAKLGEGRTVLSWSQSNVATTGIMDDKGLFYGESSSTGLGCKLFGREQPYGDIWMAEAGTINASGVPKNKMTYGTQDGSTAVGYNTDGTGYLTDTNTFPSASGSYIGEMVFDPVMGMIPVATGGNEYKQYCDSLWTNNSQTNYALRGGGLGYGRRCGAFCLVLNNVADVRDWTFGAALSCKPLA